MDARSIVKEAQSPALATGRDDRIVAWNSAALELLGLGPRQKLTGQRFYELARPSDPFGNRLTPGHIPFLEMMSHGDAVRPFQLNIHKADGSRQRISVSIVVVLAPQPERSRIVYLLRPLFRRRRADEAIDRILRTPAIGGRILDRVSSDGANGGFDLSRRQTEVVRLLAQGRSNEEIAHDLGLSIHTVRSHVQAGLHSLRVHSKAEAVAVTYREGLI